MIKIQRRGMKYKFGVLEYTQKRGLIAPISKLGGARGDRHIFIAHEVDKNNYVISFFTSKESTNLGGGKTLKNLECESGFFKFINPPVILSKNDLNSYFRDISSRGALEAILGEDLSDGETMQTLVKEAVLNFKNSFNLLPNEEVVEIAYVCRVGEKLLIAVKTRANILVVDTNSVIYQRRYVDIALSEEIDLDFFKKNLHLLNNTEEAVIGAVNEIMDVINSVND